MNELLVIIFLGTLVYFSLLVNVKNFINLIAIQGILLFAIAVMELHDLNLAHFLLIVSETLIVKAIVVPMVLYRVSRQNNIFNLKNNKTHRKSKGFNMVIISSLIIAMCYMFSYDLESDHLSIKYFTGAMSAVIIGIIIITVNRNIMIHFISFLVIENGVFLLALAVGQDMPMMVSTAILLDVFTGVLVIGLFINRIGSNFDHLETDQLSKLKD